MITRDFLLRQVHQLTQVLAAVLFHKRAGREEIAQEALDEGLRDALGLSLDELLQLRKEELLAVCRHSESLSPEKALALADVLREDESLAGQERALWLYEAARDAGDLVPYDIADRIADLRRSLEE